MYGKKLFRLYFANRKLCHTPVNFFYIDVLLAYTVSFKKAINSVIFLKIFLISSHTGLKIK